MNLLKKKVEWLNKLGDTFNVVVSINELLGYTIPKINIKGTIFIKKGKFKKKTMNYIVVVPYSSKRCKIKQHPILEYKLVGKCK